MSLKKFVLPGIKLLNLPDRILFAL